jgi:signal transduction histidine kinase/ABC-type amino acid transport substrate-binding protein
MYHHYKILNRVFVIICLSLFASAACHAFAAGSEATYVSHGAGKALVIEGDWAFQPYEFINSKGNPDGFNIELTKALMKQLGISNYVIRLRDWTKVLDDFKSGKVDLIMGITYSNDRAKTYRFGPTQSYVFQSFIYRNDSKPFTALSQLKGKTVLVEKNSIGYEIIRDSKITPHIVAVSNITEGLRELAAGKYDAAFCHEEVARFIIHTDKSHGLGNLVVKNANLAPQEYRYAGTDDSLLNNIDQALYDLKENGTFDTIHKKWFDYAAPGHISSYVYIILIILAVALAVLYSFNRILHIKVRKTNELLERKDRRMTLALRAGNISVWRYDVASRHFYNVEGNYLPSEGISMEQELSCVHESDRERFASVLNKIITEGTIPADPVVIRQNMDKHSDSYQYVEKEFSVIRDKHGKVTTIVGTVHVVTDLINIQKSLEQEKEKALQADKLKSAFLANMSHEIRTPLNAIVGFSNLLDEADDDERKEYVKIININNELLLHLISDILDLAKIESGVMPMNFEQFDMSMFFNELYSGLRQRQRHSNVDLLYKNPYSKCIICTDRNRLAQIITNFTTNAIKYTPSGHIRMGYYCIDNGIHVYVEDTGIGVPEEKQDRIFHRFEKLDDFAQGTGLGLSICKAITDTFGGRIGFDSQSGKGSVFWAWIPSKSDIVLEEADGSDGTPHKA